MSKSSVTALAATLAAAAAVTLAGCQAGHSAAGPAATSAAAASSASAAPVSPPPTGSTTGPAGAGTLAECSAGQLAIAYTRNAQIRNGALAGMSHADQVVTFTNTGTQPCDIQGYPGVAALDAAGTQVRQAARTAGPVRPVALAPGATASALVSANTAACPHPAGIAGLLVTAPDQRASTRLGPAGAFCPVSLSVGPVAPGDAAGLRL
jgi:hypothetical protein